MTKRFWVPYAPYDVESIRIWLEEKAEDGYRLKNMKPYFAVFEETDRTSLKFHLEPTVKDANKPDDEIIETRAERGWTYAGTLQDQFHVFYADKKTPDFYSDPNAVKWKYEEKLKKEKWGVFWSVLTIIPLVFLEINFMSGFSNPVLWILENLQVSHIIALVFLFSGLIPKLITYRRHRRYVEYLDEKEDFHLPSTGVFRMVSLIGNVLFFTAAIVILFLAFTSADDAYEDASKDVKVNDFGQVINLLELEQLRDPELVDNTNIEIDLYAYINESLFLDEKITLHQSAALLHSYWPGLTTTNYTAKSDGVREVLEEELIKQAIENTGDTDSVKEVYSGVTISYFDVPELRTMILSHEKRLLRLEYRGRLDLKDWKALMAEKFLKSIESPDGK